MYTVSINAIARSRLVMAGGHIEIGFFSGKASMELSSILYEKFWSFSSQALPKDLESRGLDTMDTIEDYPYRDDGLLIWAAIHKYVGSFLKLHYHSDEDVLSDAELTGFYEDLTKNGHPVKSQTFPPLNGLGDLVEILSIMIFMSTAHHAAVNFSQYTYTAYPANMPPNMRRPPPEKKGSTTEKDFMDSLPDLSTSCLALIVTNTLSRFSTPDEELYLGQTKLGFGLSEEISSLAVLQEFQVNLIAIEKQIKLRNQNRPLPYVHLLPSHIPSSIAI